MADPERSQSRREFLGASILGPAALVIVSVAETGAQGSRRATQACGESGGLTPAQTAGPYFKPNSPERTSLLEPGLAGTRLVLEGAVLTTDCRPVPRARLDFWQADARGRYDNEGHTLRGHQLTDAEGRYRLETVLPGLYPGRTRHIHVKVQAPSRPVLTTQLYFPGKPVNQRDGIFDPVLVVSLRAADGGQRARFDFVLAR